MSTERIKLGEDRVIEINPSNLAFNETTLSTYLTKEAGFYDNFGSSLAVAERVLQIAELRHERIYSEKFSLYKDMGGSDKLADARAKSDDDVVKAREVVVEVKYKVKRIQQHLRAWDKNHDNAQSLGYMMRKELDKLAPEIKHRRESSFEEELESMSAEQRATRQQKIHEAQAACNERARMESAVEAAVGELNPEDL